MKKEEKKDKLKKEEQVVKTKRQSLFSRIKMKVAERREKRRLDAERQLSEEENKQVEEKLVEASIEVDETKTPKRKKTTAIFWIFNVLLILAVLLWNIFSTGDFEPLGVFELENKYILYAMLFVVGMVVADVLSVHRMIYRRTLRSRWATSYKSVAIYRFSPLATGGQPFMISYLSGRDIPGTTAVSIPVTKLLFQNLAWLIITTVCMICSISLKMGTAISVLSIVGFILTLLIVVAIIIVSTSKAVGRKLVGFYVKLNVKLKIWNNYDKHFEQIMGLLEDYQNIMKEYTKDIFDVVYQLVLAAARLIFMYSIPFFIYCAFKGYTPEVFGEFFIYTVLVDLASHVIPLPGGAGLNVITFTWLFSTYLGGSTFWALIIWQFCTFYFYILQGLCVIGYDAFYGNRKYRWIQKKRNLQEESEDFRKMQIDNFRSEREKRRKKKEKSTMNKKLAED